MSSVSAVNIQDYKWLSWKISREGTYLAVISEVPKKWSVEEMKKTLIKNRIINFDIEKIEKVIKNSSGQMELIGPPLEYFEEGKRRYLRLQVTPIQVSFSMDAGMLQSDYTIKKEDILFLLAEKAVVYGIEYETIEEIVSNEIYGQEFIIATATPPVAGQDAIITEEIPIDVDAKPFLNEDGTVDYKKWDNIRQVAKNEVICTRIPPTPGIPGISVFGHPLSPAPGEDYALPAGMNTRVIDNETKLVAAINGFLYRIGRDICVGGVYIINGDVDYKTGNIEYFGDVLVRGNVSPDFSVVADGNISIEGFVEAAYIESKTGNIFLKNSVFGKNKGNIIAAKDIRAEHVQDTRLQAGQTLTVRAQVRNCIIQTENLIMPSDGQIIGSSVFFRGRLKCGCIGGKTESLNKFIFVENERKKFRDELQGVNSLLKKLNMAIDTLNARLFSIKSSDKSPESENQRKLLKSQLVTCNNSREQLTVKRKKLIKLIDILPDKESLISANTLMPLLDLSIFGCNKIFKQELLQFKIGWINGAIKIESL